MAGKKKTKTTKTTNGVPLLQLTMRRFAWSVAVLDDLALGVDDVLQRLERLVGNDARVARAAHSKRQKRLVRRCTLHALFEKRLDIGLVGVPRPLVFGNTPITVARKPLRRRPLHWLVVRRRHDNAIRVGQLLVARVIDKKTAAGLRIPGPHGRPQEIGLEPQQQLKDRPVELGIVLGAKRRVHPARQCRRLVVDEKAAEPHAGLAVDSRARQRVDLRVPLDRHVGPPVPRRDANLLGERICAKDGASLVAPGNDKQRVCQPPQTSQPGHSLRLHAARHKRLPLACHLTHRGRLGQRHIAKIPATFKAAHEDGHFGSVFDFAFGGICRAVHDVRLCASDPFQVDCQISNRNVDALIVVRVNQNECAFQVHMARPRRERHNGSFKHSCERSASIKAVS